MSLVTTTTESSSRSRRQSEPTSVVLPLPTGPPMPIRRARSTPAAGRASKWRGRTDRCAAGRGGCHAAARWLLRIESRVGRVDDGDVLQVATNILASRLPWRSPSISVSVPPSAGSSGGGHVAQSAHSSRPVVDAAPARACTPASSIGSRPRSRTAADVTAAPRWWKASAAASRASRRPTRPRRRGRSPGAVRRVVADRRRAPAAARSGRRRASAADRADGWSRAGTAT